MDEFTAILRARELVKRSRITSVPARIEAYVEAVGECGLRVDGDLGSDEPGYSTRIGAKHYIVVNGKDLPERRRFTACHELGHIVLDLSSEHDTGPSWSYSKRPANEIYCDVFAAELLLPYTLFKPVADLSLIGLAALDEISGNFQASVTATGSRFAAAVDTPYAFVISEGGAVRYASRSKALRDVCAWIAPGSPLPIGSPSVRHEPIHRTTRSRLRLTPGSPTGSAEAFCSNKPVTWPAGTKLSPSCGSTMTRYPRTPPPATMPRKIWA